MIIIIIMVLIIMIIIIIIIIMILIVITIIKAPCLGSGEPRREGCSRPGATGAGALCYIIIIVYKPLYEIIVTICQYDHNYFTFHSYEI